MSGSKTVSTTAPELPRKVGLTMPQGARLIGCSQRHFYDLAYAGEIPTYLVGGRRFVDEQATDAYVMRCKNLGPRFTRGTGKRAPGRPKKTKSEREWKNLRWQE
jgi:hypothetical protein